MCSTILCSLLVLNLGQTASGPRPYPRPDLLIAASDLAKPEAAKKFRILDTRIAKEWKEGHIPQSIAVPLGEWNKQFTAGPDVKWWTNELGRLGIDVDTPVAICGEDMRETARAWWILRYWGVKDVRILNGGWTTWTASKHEQAKGEYDKLPFSATSPKLTPADKRLATMDQVKDSLKDKVLQIIDARSEGEFCGDIKTTKRAGAIPGAVNLEWKVLLDPKTQQFKDAAELAEIFKQAGIDLTKPSVAHCQSGGRSSVMVFAMELMGAADIRNYYRSWAEWGNVEDTPVVVPQKK